MTYSEEKNKYGYSALDVYEYREAYGVSMAEAHSHFKSLWKEARRKEMAKLIESGTLEDIHKIVAMLVEEY